MPVNGETVDVTISLEKLSAIDTGGAPFDVQLKSNIAFVSDYYDGLSAFDVSNESNPILLDNLPLSNAHYMHVVEDLAFVACWDSGLKIVNISDSTNLTVIGSFDDGVEVGGVFVSNNVAILTKIDGGTLVLNVTDPTQPSKLSQYNAAGIPNVCKIKNNIAFVVYWQQTGSRVVFLNLTNPLTPNFIGEYSDVAETYDIQVKDDLLIIGNNLAGVYFVNISDLTNPIKISQYDTNGAVLGVDSVDHFVFIGDSYTIEVVDFSNITGPQKVGSYDNSGVAQKLQIDSNLVYCCNRPQGLVIYRFTINEETTPGAKLFILPTLCSLILIVQIIIFKRKK
ncbi:MAG: LVIVD repeat-containing protein [Candidatus Heimdallarchaeota archaeon]